MVKERMGKDGMAKEGMAKDGMVKARYWAGLLWDVVTLWLNRNAFNHAGSLAFYTLFSLAPVVIIAVTIIGVVLGPEAAQGEIVGQLEDVMGREAAETVERTVASARRSEEHTSELQSRPHLV